MFGLDAGFTAPTAQVTRPSSRGEMMASAQLYRISYLPHPCPRIPRPSSHRNLSGRFSKVLLHYTLKPSRIFFLSRNVSASGELGLPTLGLRPAACLTLYATGSRESNIKLLQTAISPPLRVDLAVFCWRSAPTRNLPLSSATTFRICSSNACRTKSRKKSSQFVAEFNSWYFLNPLNKSLRSEPLGLVG